MYYMGSSNSKGANLGEWTANCNGQWGIGHVKTAEPIELLLGVVSRMGPGNVH